MLTVASSAFIHRSMKKRMHVNLTYRVLLRPARGSPEAEQRSQAAVVAGLGATVQEYAGDLYEEWAEHSRPGDVLIVHRLELIPPTRSRRCPSPACCRPHPAPSWR